MKSDYADNWEALPGPVQAALEPIIERLDAGADLLFDRRRNLSFEAAVKDLSVPGIAAITDGLLQLRELLARQVTVEDAAQGELLFDSIYPLTVYDLPLYTPCLYLSQLAQYMEEHNVRVWKDDTARRLVDALLTMARSVRPDIETARVMIAALHDMVLLYPDTRSLLENAGQAKRPSPNAAHIAATALQLLDKRIVPGDK